MAARKRRRNIFLNRAGTVIWWTRMPLPDGTTKRVSTGVRDERLAQDMADALPHLLRMREFEVLDAIADGRCPMLDAYRAFTDRSLPTLRERLADVDVEPFVNRWVRDTRGAESVTDRTVEDYLRQLRTLIPEGQPFLRSELTEARVAEWLSSLEVGSSTKRRYLDALRVFVRWGRRRIPLTTDPVAGLFEAKQAPRNAPPRRTYFEHPDVLRVLDAMDDCEERVMMTLLFGTGMELGAAEAACGVDVIREDRAVFAHGTKNGYRDRVCFVDHWAWDRVEAHICSVLPTARLFQHVTRARLRIRFYEGQVRAGMAVAPEPGASKRGQFHTVHDCRHSFCVNRTLGLDGEPRRDLTYLADQLGHADEMMVMRIYNQFRLKERIASQERHALQRRLQEARHA